MQTAQAAGHTPWIDEAPLNQMLLRHMLDFDNLGKRIWYDPERRKTSSGIC